MYLDYSNEFNISSQVRLRFLHLPLIEERLGFLLEINKNFFYKSQIGSYRTFLFQGTRDLSSPWHKKSNKFSNIHWHLLRARIVFKNSTVLCSSCVVGQKVVRSKRHYCDHRNAFLKITRSHVMTRSVPAP